MLEWRTPSSFTGTVERCSRATPPLYEDGRPGYPPEVFEILRDRCGLGRDSEVAPTRFTRLCNRYFVAALPT